MRTKFSIDRCVGTKIVDQEESKQKLCGNLQILFICDAICTVPRVVIRVKICGGL